MTATANTDRDNHLRRKVYLQGPHGIEVPFAEVSLADSEGPDGPVRNEPLRLYDTSGPGSDPRVGLRALRLAWITGRGDVSEYEGRTSVLRDDGRGAVRREGAPEAFPGPARRPFRARVTGFGLPSSATHVWGRSPRRWSSSPSARASTPRLVRDELASGRAILPANVNHPELEPMAIGSDSS